MNFRQEFRSISPFAGVLMLVLAIAGIFFITKSILALLSFIAPVLFILTLIVDYKVVLDYGKFLINLFKESPIKGIFGIVLSIVGVHLVVAFLFGKALLKQKINKIKGNPNRKEDNYTDFEEVEELELPDLTKSKEEMMEYDSLFDD